MRAAAGQRNVLGGGRGEHARSARRARAGADQRRVRQAAGEAHADDGPPLQRIRNGRRRADHGRGRRSPAHGRSVDHARGAHPLRDVDRHRESAAGHRRRRRAPRQEPHRRRDELVRRAADRRAHHAVRCADRGVGQVHRGSAGHGLRVRAQERAREMRGTRTSLALDLYDQWTYMEKTTQWRFTPPTHIVVALDAALGAVPGRGRAARAARALHGQLQGAARRHGARSASGASCRRRSRRRSSSPSTRPPIPVTRSRPSTRACATRDSCSIRASSRRWRRSASDASARSRRPKCVMRSMRCRIRSPKWGSPR